MKHLPKHLRPRWRYLAVGIETWPDATLSRGAFQREVWYAAQNLLGDPGSADADLTVVRFRHGDGVGEALLRVRRDEVRAGRAALACVDDVDGRPVGLRVRGVSGTIRACEERYLGRAGGLVDERDVVFEGEPRRGHVRERVVDVETPRGFVGATDADI
ncbi:Rpp14/Pop5 family protein [Halorarum salinum]|uniref:Ribonuclease P protein component 2 n=1 Tax=Halorarum salinum TaxID=2743089 RepID=A0A7D5LCS5_9EURY|nr:Rpp14/Pop5 family protein [Halobaculum salinum]QLG62949.1 ribonuclease P [Halobaculum salinum]